MATDTESRLVIVEQRLGDLRQEMSAFRKEIHDDIADLRKDIRQVLLFVLGTWITTFLALALAWINLSGQIAGIRPH